MKRRENRGRRISRGITDYLGVEVATDCLLSPRLVVKLSPSLFLWVSYHICHGLLPEKNKTDKKKNPIIIQDCILTKPTGDKLESKNPGRRTNNIY